MKRTILTAALLVSLAAPAWAQDFDRGDDAFERGDYATALREWEPLALSGDARAQFAIGYLYGSGKGVTQNYKQSTRWYREAAEQGHVSGQYNLGLAYAFGKGVSRNDSAAARWFRLAAEQGHSKAQNNIGVLYRDGRGVAKDRAAAIRWFRKAALQGNELAEENLKKMGVSIDQASVSERSAPATQKPKPSKPKADPAMVREIQKHLARLGYDPGPVDGLMGKRTRRAIESYQDRHNHLRADGQPSKTLLNMLRAEAATAETVAPTPSPEAVTDDSQASQDLGDLGDF